MARRSSTSSRFSSTTPMHSATTAKHPLTGAVPRRVTLKGGLSNYLDVLTAKRNLFDVELSLTATKRLRLVSMIQLYKALGGGWSPSDAVQRSGDPGLIAAPAGSRFLSIRSIE